MRRRRWAAVAALAAVAGAAVVAGSQGRRQLYVQSGDLGDIQNVPYDGTFTFARIRFEPMGGGGGFFRVDRKWDHDTPRAELNFTKILSELTTLSPFMDGGNIYAFDDPELFKHPIAYLCEVGFWNPTDTEAQGLRDYLAKGGFVIVDDFVGGHWYNFEAQLRRVLPELRLQKLDPAHPVFDSFFHITSTEQMSDPNFRGARSEFWGLYEDNDPKKRLMMIVNYNNDIGEHWEYSNSGFFPVDETNEAYKLGVNYIIYAMTH